MKILPFHLGLLCLAGCATAPLDISSNHPAHPQALQSKDEIARPMLRPDSDTLRTKNLIDERAAQAEKTTAETIPSQPPASSQQGTLPQPMPMEKMDHEMSMPMNP